MERFNSFEYSTVVEQFMNDSGTDLERFYNGYGMVFEQFNRFFKFLENEKTKFLLNLFVLK